MSASSGIHNRGVYSLHEWAKDEDYSDMIKRYLPGDARAYSFAGAFGTSTTKLTPKKAVMSGLIPDENKGEYQEDLIQFAPKVHRSNIGGVHKLSKVKKN